METEESKANAEEARRERLGQFARENTAKGYNQRYSVFIRRAKLVLPIIALIIAAVVFSWSAMSPEVVSLPQSEEDLKNRQVSKNELLGTRFESRDEKNQPFTITAKRAVQDRSNEDIVTLSEPLADMLLNSGEWIAIEAQNGTFEQDAQMLFLEKDVKLFHDKGYQMQTQTLSIDLTNNTAKTDNDVYAFGPKGTLNAKGLKGDAKLEYLSFTGPAKLVLERHVSKSGVEILP